MDEALVAPSINREMFPDTAYGSRSGLIHSCGPMPSCPSCNADVLDIDVKCKECGAHLGSTGAQRLIGTTVLNQYEIIDVRYG